MLKDSKLARLNTEGKEENEEKWKKEGIKIEGVERMSREKLVELSLCVAFVV